METNSVQKPTHRLLKVILFAMIPIIIIYLSSSSLRVLGVWIFLALIGSQSLSGLVLVTVIPLIICIAPIVGMIVSFILYTRNLKIALVVALLSLAGALIPFAGARMFFASLG
jgi:hypothetical protein